MRKTLPAFGQRGEPSDFGGSADRHRCRGETPLRHGRHRTPTPPDRSGDSAPSRTAAGDSAAPRQPPWRRSGTSRYEGAWRLRSRVEKVILKTTQGSDYRLSTCSVSTLPRTDGLSQLGKGPWRLGRAGKGLDDLGSNSDIREDTLSHYLVLYAVMDTTRALPSIRRHHQLYIRAIEGVPPHLAGSVRSRPFTWRTSKALSRASA